MIEIPFVGGPRDGQIGQWEDLGTTWHRSDVFDEDGNYIGVYHCDGPGSTEIRFISHEELQRQHDEYWEVVLQWQDDPEALQNHVERLLKEQNGRTEI